MRSDFIKILVFFSVLVNGCHIVQRVPRITDSVKIEGGVKYTEEAFKYNGLVDCNTGRYQNNSKLFVSTDFIDVRDYKFLEYSLPYSECSGITFYDAQKKKIFGIKSDKGQHIYTQLPDNTKYIRLSQRTNDGMDYSFSLYEKYQRSTARQLDTDYSVVFSPDEFLYNDIDQSGFGFINPKLKGTRKAIVRIPVHIMTTNGTIIVACQVIFEKDGKNYSWVYAARSQNGKEWDKQVLYKGSNPNLLYDRIHHRIFAITDSSFIFSDNDGIRWSEMQSLGIEKPDGWNEFFQCPTAGIQLENGVLATVFELMKYKDGKIKNNVNVIVYSRDFGQTWELSPYTPTTIIANEATIVEYKPNQIMINARGGIEVSMGSDNPGRRVFVQNKTSIKKREEWAIEGWRLHESDKQIIEPVCNASFITIKNVKQRIGLFCNPHVHNNPRRDLMLQKTSNFIHWEEVGLLTPRDSTVFGYCSIANYDNRLSFVYESIKKGILYTDITDYYDELIFK